MKKKIFNIGMFVAFALVAGYNVYSSQKSDDMSDMALVNVEALAANEKTPNCDTGCVDDGAGCLCGIWFPTYKVP